MNRLGLEYITLLGLSPPDFIRAAAAVGCAHVSLFPEQSQYNPDAHPFYSLAQDVALRRETAACLREEGVSLSLVDGFALFPGRPPESLRPAFDMLAELGARRVNTVSFVDWDRTVDETTALVAIAAEYEVTVTVEPCPVLTVRTLAEALTLIAAVDRPNFKLLIDTMHISRTGESADLRAVAPGLIDYVQISDGPLAMPDAEAYMDEAMNERMIPGEGEMPLVEMLRAIAPGIVVSAEVPLRSLHRQGLSDVERARRAIEGTRRVLAAL